MTDSIDTAHLSRLAQLALSDAERADANADLRSIVKMIDAMQDIDTQGVAPLANPLDASARLRPDAITEVIDRERNLANAPEQADGLFLVPRVVE